MAAGRFDVLAAASAGLTYFQPYREYTSPCGYCRRPHNKGRVAYGMHCHRMSALDYDAMLDDGWMRSGSHVYLPSNTKSCCPNFVVRCDATRYVPTHDHLRVLHRLAAHLRGEVPLVLPPLTDDVLERALRLALVGRAGEAAAGIVKFKDDGDASGVAAGAGAGGDDDDEEMGGHTGVGPAAKWAHLLAAAVPGLKRVYADGTALNAAQLEGARALSVHHALTAPLQAHEAAPPLLAAAVGVASACCAVATTWGLASPPASPAPSIAATSPLVPLWLARLGEKVSVSAVLPDDGGRRRGGKGAIRGDAAAPLAAAAGAAPPGTAPCTWHTNAALTLAHLRAESAAAGGVATLEDVAAAVSVLVDAMNGTWAAVGGGFVAAPAPPPARTGFIAITATVDSLSSAAAGSATQSALWTSLQPILDAGTAALAAQLSGQVGTAHGINCWNAHDARSRALLDAHYHKQQVARERAGRAMWYADPGNFVLNNDDDGPSDDEAGAGAGGGSGGAAAEARRAKRAEKLAKEVTDSTAELEAFLSQGLGDAMRALRARGTPVSPAPPSAGAISEGTSHPHPHQAVPRDRLAHLPLVVEEGAVAPNSDVPVTWPSSHPSGRGHRLTVHLAKPTCTPESHELYTRFNLSLHRGTPKSNSREAYTRHLVKSPIVPMSPACLGTLMRLRAGAWRPDPAIEGDQLWDAAAATALATTAADAGIPQLAPSRTSGVNLLRLAAEDPMVACALMSLRGRGLYGTPTAAPEAEALWRMNRLPLLPTALDAAAEMAPQLAAALGMPLAATVLSLYHVASRLHSEAAALAGLTAATAGAGTPPAGSEVPPHVLQAMGFGGMGGGVGAGGAGGGAADARVRYAQTRLRSLLSPASVQSLLVTFVSDHDTVLQWLLQCWDAVMESLPRLEEMDGGGGGPGGGVGHGGGAGGDAAVAAAGGGGTTVGGGTPLPPHVFDAFFAPVPDAPTSADDVPGKIAVDGWDLAAGFGSFHHEYRLDGVLVAVSVLDILPTRVASVYFFYDPDLRHLQLGKLSVMVELWMAHRVRAVMAADPALWGMTRTLPRSGEDDASGGGRGVIVPAPTMQWWDANYYVHAVRTMNYKRTFQPSQLLCPILRQGHWVDMSRETLLWLDESPDGPLACVDSAATSPRDSAEAARGLADSLALVEVVEAEEQFPNIMVELSGGAVYPVSGLSDTSQDKLRRGLLRYVRAVGLGSLHRFLIDPRWVAGLETTLQEEQEERQRAAAAAAAIETGAGGGEPEGGPGGLGAPAGAPGDSHSAVAGGGAGTGTPATAGRADSKGDSE